MEYNCNCRGNYSNGLDYSSKKFDRDYSGDNIFDYKDKVDYSVM